jgi:hypothetical protein
MLADMLEDVGAGCSVGRQQPKGCAAQAGSFDTVPTGTPMASTAIHCRALVAAGLPFATEYGAVGGNSPPSADPQKPMIRRGDCPAGGAGSRRLNAARGPPRFIVCATPRGFGVTVCHCPVV